MCISSMGVIRRVDKSLVRGVDKRLDVAVLLSGGKDSNLALLYASRFANVKCLIILESKKNDSYMFHTPNISFTKLQAEAIGIPYIVQETSGDKELELADLEKAIKRAIKEYKIAGVVSGAIGSIYQASRIARITNKLNIECFNPLWQKDQKELLQELINEKFDVIIIGVFGFGLNKVLGSKIDKKFIEDVSLLEQKYKINPAGEGGEYESFVLYAPFFKKRLIISESHIETESGGGKILQIDEMLIK